MEGLKIVMPKGFGKDSINFWHYATNGEKDGISNWVRGPQNGICGDYIKLNNGVERITPNSYSAIPSQELVPSSDQICKTSRSSHGNYKTFERLTNDGYYSVVRQNYNDEIIGGYEMNLKPKSNALADGFAGKLQKAALKIGTNADGCERPVLRRVAGFLFDIARKIR